MQRPLQIYFKLPIASFARLRLHVASAITAFYMNVRNRRIISLVSSSVRYYTHIGHVHRYAHFHLFIYLLLMDNTFTKYRLRPLIMSIAIILKIIWFLKLWSFLIQLWSGFDSVFIVSYTTKELLLLFKQLASSQLMVSRITNKCPY